MEQVEEGFGFVVVGGDVGGVDAAGASVGEGLVEEGGEGGFALVEGPPEDAVGAGVVADAAPGGLIMRRLKTCATRERPPGMDG